jgi:hypothetical protein
VQRAYKMPTHRVVTMDELTQYLHLPEKMVAKELGICLTSLKKLCRQHGITRWPYRKVTQQALSVFVLCRPASLSLVDTLLWHARFVGGVGARTGLCSY